MTSFTPINLAYGEFWNKETFTQDFVDFFNSIKPSLVIPTVQQVLDNSDELEVLDKYQSGAELDDFKKGGGYISEELKNG